MKEYVLRTKNLLLRPIEKTDAGLLWPYVSNPEVSKDMSWSAHQDISETHQFIEGVLLNMENGKNITWCILHQGIFCGVFSLIAILRTHRSLTYDRAELAYWLGPEFEGKGIMTEAGNAILGFAFKELKLNKIVVGHHTHNEKSQNLILRLGFKFLYEETEVFRKGGEWITCKFYELKSKDFSKEN